MNGDVTRFGQVEFCAARNRLAVAGRIVPIDRSSAAILTLLLHEAGQEVDKDHLLAAGWPGRVVHENSLAKAIGRLRQALGQDGAALETVHGYGYRLAVEPVVAAASATAARPGLRLGHLAMVLLVVLAASGAALWFATRPGETQPAAERPLLRGEPPDALGRVLWVDDNPDNNAQERRALEARKIAVYQVTTSEEALSLLAMYEYRAVISDMNRAGKPLAGLELVREMRRRRDPTPFFLYTFVPSAAQHNLLAEAGGQGAAVTPEELYAAVLPLFERQRAAPDRSASPPSS